MYHNGSMYYTISGLSENAHKAGADVNVLEHALKLVADKR